jgi:hypothetical protein
MATIKIETVSVAHGTRTRTVTLTEAAFGRFVAAYKVILGDPAATDLQALSAWASGLIQGTVDNVQRAERESAAKSAYDGVAAIGVS